MPQPEYHHYDEGGERVVVLGCETCGCPVLPEFRNEHTLWHEYVDLAFDEAHDE
jgi:hypothetical protein